MLILDNPQATLRWQKMANQLQAIVDGMGKSIDPGILDTCIVLNLLGFTTDMSCEGHLHEGSPAPWVRFTNAEVVRLEHEVAELYREGRIYDDAIVTQVRTTGVVPTEQQRYLDEAHAREREARLILGSDMLRLLEYIERFMQGRIIPNDQRLIVFDDVAGTFQLQSQGALVSSILMPDLKQQRLLAYQGEMQAFTAHLISCLY